ncbi:Acetyl xylan esterase (AXE1) [Roseimaritima multifibrata]|uniref:Acetyl xylan esterase (AXE1) n=1 Tax=Roseimaritima multifibrata TaxID=1930274 RepID=A0A517MAN8_9BACT|nr:alpha/beta hydrolase family protein [Roseimaritima multifibrata]QDS91921.1 Acetyl xylan esterase (AXE1) [Roseimaritima multifibrata]
MKRLSWPPQLRYPLAALLLPTAIALTAPAHLAMAQEATKSARETPAFQKTQVVSGDAVHKDSRSQPLTDLNGHFHFDPPKTLEAWEARAEDLRTQVQIATGLWPMPERTPLNPVIHGAVARDGFSIEKVYFESIPGHFVSGFLFRPETINGQVPGILCPHGHGGRMHMYSVEDVRRKITLGQERFEDSGRSPKLARCAQLARMGCVVFIFDMIGYADSQQLSYDLAHRYGEPRDRYAGGKTSEDGGWGFFTVQAESRLQSIMGMQTWNAIRSLDFLEQLPEVDPKRLAVTGNSGGGTQTILLGALDERPIVSFPNGMVSVSMQGGCTCENCSLLRVGSGNVELAALMAPRPQAMTAADDWTIDMMTDGYPELQQVYQLYGKKDNVLCRDFTYFPHNFNYVSRAMMYHWMNKHLQLKLPEPIVEEDWPGLTEEEALVWTDEHPAPAGGPEHEEAVTRFLTEQAQAKIQPLLKNAAENPEPFQALVGKAWETIIGRKLPNKDAIESDAVETISLKDAKLEKMLVRLTTQDESIPVVKLRSTKSKPNGTTVLWLDGNGKASLLNEQGAPSQQAQQWLDQGATILAADLLGQGEFTEDGNPTQQQRVVSNPRQYAGYTFTYNPSLFVHRVHDVLTLLAYAQGSGEVILSATSGAEPIAAAALAVSDSQAKELQLQANDFRFANLKSYRDPEFTPGAAKYGDMPALLALVKNKGIAITQIK